MWLTSVRLAASNRLFGSVDGASLALFRIAFGGIMLWEVGLHVGNGWIARYWVEPQFHFTYYGMSWIRPWPGLGMDLHWLALGVLAACIMLGAWYRISAALFFLGFTYVFLLDQARYLNHFYLMSLISFLMIFLPAHRMFSIDAWRNPEMRSDLVPAWSVWLLRFQVGVPYFFGGIAKINADWLRGEPIRMWLPNLSDFPVLGRFFNNEPAVWLFTYGALFLDLFVVFLLLNRRTRSFGFLAITAFHFMNARFFPIGIFPWLMIAATTIYFQPDWPHRVWQDIKQRHPFRLPALITGFVVGFLIGGFIPTSFSLVQALIGACGVAIGAYHLDESFRRPTLETNPDQRKRRRTARPESSTPPRQYQQFPARTWVLALIGIWVAAQLIIPLRHLAIPGNVQWTEEGQYFSWHMIVKHKASFGDFVVTDPITGDKWTVDPGDYLTSMQVGKMTIRPYMIVQFANYLEDELRAEGYGDLEIRARLYSTLNGRKAQLLIGPEVDLTRVSYPWLRHADWILPLKVPLDNRMID